MAIALRLVPKSCSIREGIATFTCATASTICSMSSPPQMALPHAVLIRAIEPVWGIETMLQRRNMPQLKTNLSAGPGTCSQALGLTTASSGLSLTDDTSMIWIETPVVSESFQIQSGTRVGVAYAEESAFLPWRFSIAGNKWVSKAKGL